MTISAVRGAGCGVRISETVCGVRVRVRGQFGCGVWVCGVDQCAGAGCGVRLNWGARTSLV